jgi:hypothetical protein
MVTVGTVRSGAIVITAAIGIDASPAARVHMTGTVAIGSPVPHARKLAGLEPVGTPQNRLTTGNPADLNSQAFVTIRRDPRSVDTGARMIIL